MIVTRCSKGSAYRANCNFLFAAVCNLQYNDMTCLHVGVTAKVLHCTLDFALAAWTVADGHFAAKLCLRLSKAYVASEIWVTLAS